MKTWITSKAAAELAEKDAPLVASNASQYVSANKEAYFILTNTWTSIVHDVCGPRAAQSLVNYFYTRGVIPCISDANNLANDLILQEFCQDSLQSDLSFLFVEDPRESLQVLRYPKRFSPLKADLVRKQGLADFLSVNAKCKGEPAVILYSQGWSRRPNGEWRLQTGPVLKYYKNYPRWLVKMVRNYTYQLLPENTNVDIKTLEDTGYFSNGTTAFGSKTVLQKLWEYTYDSYCLGDVFYPLGGIPETIPDTDFVRVVAVPKSYKVPRLIAEVPAYRQFCMQGLRTISERCTQQTIWKDCIILDDQSFNQEGAFVGSVQGTVATIDLSAASDSISQCLAEELLPSNWLAAIDAINPKWMLVEGQRIRRWIFQTSGNGSTFDFESKIFLSIALAATEYVSLYEHDLIPPRVYGDDLECDVRVYDTLVDFLDMLGFVVNKDKSFTVPSRYRESCGAEFWCGLDTSTKYFPRKPINLSRNEGWQSVIELQHKLFSYPTADQFLVEYVRSNMKRIYGFTMTSSRPGSDCSDLWEQVPFYLKGEAPHAAGCKLPDDPSIYLREGHYTLVTRYPRSLKDPVPAMRNQKPRLFLRGNDCVYGDDDILNIYRYKRFLQHGPSFDTKLDELLGVRSARQSMMAQAYIPESRWLVRF